MRVFTEAPPVDYEAYPVRTDDGFELTLFRSRPTVASLRREARPVLLLPGANSNRFTFGVIEGLTLPATLNAAGRDVWLLDFRGSRSSRYLRAGRPPIDLDRKLDMDLPAAVRTVLQETGAERLDLVGHSLGGVFAYCFCMGPGAELVGRVVTLAAPASFAGFFGPVAPLMHHPARWLSPVAKRLKGIGVDRAARLPGPLPHLFAMNNHLRPRSMSAAHRRAWLEHGIEDLPGGDLAQLMRWITTGRYVGSDGRDRGRRLADVHTPTLVIRVEGDGLVPGQSVTDAHEQLGATDKSYLVIGKSHGATRNYRHADILLAPSAVYDVHPHVIGWLNRAEAAEAAESLTRPATRSAASPGQSA
jgi:pimeloyl-ACP methyl ester carboxylesterase